MKRALLTITSILLAAILLAGCAGGPAAQPLTFTAAPWQNGEVSHYDIVGKDGKLAGVAQWTWRASGDGWVQAYETNLAGRLDRGEVTTDAALRPQSAWRELGGMRYDTTYGSGKVSMKSTDQQGAISAKEIAMPDGAVDNDLSLQVQRALPLAAGYATRYTDVIPTNFSQAPVKLSVSGAETITVPAGTFTAWHVVMDFGSGSHDAWYAQATPNLMIKYRNRTSGAEFNLRSWQVTAGAPVQGAAAVAAPTPAPVTGSATPAVPVPANTPLLVASLVFQYPVMLIFPLLLGWWIHRRYQVAWGVFGVGALTFIASQVGHIPFNWAIGLIGGGRGVGLWPLPLVALVAGLSAGVFEEGARWIVLTFFLKRARGWRAALQFGAGHGAAESIIFGLLGLSGLVSMLVMRSLDPAALGVSGAALEQTRAAVAAFWATPWYTALLGGFERVMAITLHISYAVLVMRAVTRRQWGYLAAAIGLHTLVDAWSVWPGRLAGLWGLEAGVLVFALFSLWLIVRLREEPAAGPETGQPEMTGIERTQPVASAASLQPQPLSTEELARRADDSRYES